MLVHTWASEQFYQFYSNVNLATYEPKRELKLRGFRAGLFAAYAILLAIGVGGNCWVITVMGRLLRQTRTEAPRSVQIYIFALCCCDLLALSFLSLLLLDLAYGHWIIPYPWICKLYLTSESVNKFGAPFLLTSLTSFCYVTICRHPGSSSSSQNTSTPNLFRSMQQKNGGGGGNGNNISTTPCCSSICRPTSSKFALIMVASCSVIVLGLVAPIFVYSDIYYVVVTNGSRPEDIRFFLPKCVLQPPEQFLSIFTVYSFVLAFLVPTVLITFFYSSVLYYVRQNGKWMRAERSQRFWRVAKTSMGLAGFYVLCWSPYFSMSLYYYFTPHTQTGAGSGAGSGGRSHAGLVLSYFVHMLPYINCSGYPILYTMLNRRIRDEYSKAKAVSRDRRRRRQLAMARGSIFSNFSWGSGFGGVGVTALSAPIAWLWAFGHRQRQAVVRQGGGHHHHVGYSSTETNSVDMSVHQIEETTTTTGVQQPQSYQQNLASAKTVSKKLTRGDS